MDHLPEIHTTSGMPEWARLLEEQKRAFATLRIIGPYIEATDPMRPAQHREIRLGVHVWAQIDPTPRPGVCLGWIDDTGVTVMFLHDSAPTRVELSWLYVRP